MKRKLLIVEDEPILARTVAALLETDAYQVFFAGNGLQAAGMIEAEKPDIILSDLVMPGLDGYRLLQWIRERGFMTAFILMTVKSSAFGPLERGWHRPDFFLEKPFDRHRLLEAIRLAENGCRVYKDRAGAQSEMEKNETRCGRRRNVPK